MNKIFIQRDGMGAIHMQLAGTDKRSKSEIAVQAGKRPKSENTKQAGKRPKGEIAAGDILKMLVIIPAVLVLILAPSDVRAEDRDVRNMTHRERLFVGGFLGLQLGTFTAVSVNLHAGYLITNRLSAGISGNYQYTNDRWFGESYASHVYGGGAFVRFRLYSQLFVHTEYERIRLQSRLPPLNPDYDPADRRTITEDNYFVGAGYGLPLSDRVRLNLLFLYNLNENSQVYFDNPFFRVGLDIYL